MTWSSCLVRSLQAMRVWSGRTGKDRAVLLKVDGAAEFEPLPGRKMKGYVILANPLGRDRKELAHWISRSLDYASALSAKSKKAVKPAAKRATKKNV